MTSRRLEAAAEEIVRRAVEDNDVRIHVFRLLALYEVVEGDFTLWCQRLHANPSDPVVFDHFDRVHVIWMVSHMKLDAHQRDAWLRLGHAGLRLNGGKP